MTRAKVVGRLIAFTPPVLDACCQPIGRCILATAVGIEVLRAFDIDAAPLSVNVTLANAQYRQVLGRGGDAATAVARGGHLMLSANAAGGAVQANEWGGHLVIAVPSQSVLLDLDSRQFNRPRERIIVPPASIFAWPAGTRQREYREAGGVHLVIETVEDDRYLRSPDWTDPGRRLPLARRLVHAIRAGRLG
jgi:hypothetical protein